MKSTKSNSQQLSSESKIISKVLNSKIENYERTQIEGTVFTMVKIEEEQYILCIGTGIISDKVWEHEREVLNYVESKPWELLNAWAIWVAKQVIKKEKHLNNENNEQ